MAEQNTADNQDTEVDNNTDGSMEENQRESATQGNGEPDAAMGQPAAGDAAGGELGRSSSTMSGAAADWVGSALTKPLSIGVFACIIFFAMLFSSLPSMLFEQPIDLADNTGPGGVYQEFKQYALDAYDKEIESRKAEIEAAFASRVARGEFDRYDDVVMTYEFNPTEAVFRAGLEDSAVLIIAMFELSTDEWRGATFQDFMQAVNSVSFWHNTVTVNKESEEGWTEREDGESIRYVHMVYNIHDKGIDQFRGKFDIYEDVQYIKAIEMAYNIRVYFGEIDDMPMGGITGSGGNGGGSGSYAGGSTHDLVRQKLNQLEEQLEYQGGCIIPLQSYSYISSEFGLRNYAKDPIHTGIDFAAAQGTPVYSAMDGIVLMIRDTGPQGFGKHIVVYHGYDEQGRAITTMYAHLSRYGSYGEGAAVRAGDTIGYVGSTGLSEGPHLHFEYQINGSAHNPRLILPL